MDMGTISMGLSQMKTTQQTSISVMKMAMDTAKMQTVDLTEMIQTNTKIMEQSVNPNLGVNIDIKL